MFIQLNDLDSIEPRIDFFKQISELRNLLYTPGIELRFSTEADRKKFIRDRGKWSDYVNAVAIDIGRVLSDELIKNGEDLKKGIENIKRSIEEVQNAVGLLVLIGNALEVIAKVVALAA
jgi:hypothetical protein